MGEKQENDSIRDIIEVKPQIMKVIQDEETAKLIMDDLYLPILTVLRTGPKTVKEIEIEYNRIAKVKKTDKTIYRYLKVLKDAGLVVPAGQRVVLGKTATETLFSRTASAFYLRNEQAEYWRTEDGKGAAKTLGIILSSLFDKQTVNQDKFAFFLEKLSKKRTDELEHLLSKVDKTILEGISGLEWQRFTAVLNLASMFAVLLKDNNFLEKLEGCFK